MSGNCESLPDDQRQFYQDMGYEAVHKLNGEIVGLYQFIFTVGIVVGIDETGYKHRFCYDSALKAAIALGKWGTDGGNEPKGYIKRKPEVA